MIFNEPKMSSEARIPYPAGTRIAKWIVRNSQGYIRDEKQADALLVIVSASLLIISLYFIFFGGKTKLPPGIREVPPQGLPIN